MIDSHWMPRHDRLTLNAKARLIHIEFQGMIDSHWMARHDLFTLNAKAWLIHIEFQGTIDSHWMARHNIVHTECKGTIYSHIDYQGMIESGFCLVRSEVPAYTRCWAKPLFLPRSLLNISCSNMVSLGVRPPGLDFRIMYLEGSVTWLISPFSRSYCIYSFTYSLIHLFVHSSIR